MRKLILLALLSLTPISAIAGEPFTQWRWNLVLEMTDDEPYNTDNAILILACDNGYTRTLSIFATTYSDTLDAGTYNCHFRVEVEIDGVIVSSQNSITTTKIVDGATVPIDVLPKTATNIEVK